jgi:transposase
MCCNTGLQISTVRADNGKGEFRADFQAFLQDKGVIFELSPANKHSLNGVVERIMQTIKNMARSMQYATDTPASLWCYAIEYAVYLKN